MALFEVVVRVVVFARVMRLVSDTTVGLSLIMARLMALVSIEVLLTVGLLAETVGSSA
ncbi:hypothetical protein [Psychrobacter sp. KH172YL61]|uniref:hypothetical protein n=1 Tax=Psychrobacter sp. KH172YL61 TaxID=2517899 RepID=UPI001F083865|nr:hypothetical protein [Psychrobacter sp. KH172YL61]